MMCNHLSSWILTASDTPYLAIKQGPDAKARFIYTCLHEEMRHCPKFYLILFEEKENM